MRLYYLLILGSYIIRKIGPELRAFKNSSSEKFLSVTVTKKVKSVEKKVRDISVWFKIQRAPQNSYVQFESFENPGQFLARNLKDDSLKVVSNKSFDTTKFNIKIIKGKMFPTCFKSFVVKQLPNFRFYNKYETCTIATRKEIIFPCDCTYYTKFILVIFCLSEIF